LVRNPAPESCMDTTLLVLQGRRRKELVRGRYTKVAFGLWIGRGFVGYLPRRFIFRCRQVNRLQRSRPERNRLQRNRLECNQLERNQLERQCIAGRWLDVPASADARTMLP